MAPIKVALLGSIPKGDKARESFKDWKVEYIEKLTKLIPNVQFLHGDLISDSVGPELVVGHDLWFLKHADIVFVNASSKIGAGTAQEMVIAKYYKKPLVTILPKNTHHRRSNIVFHGVTIKDWIHPFIFVSSDYVAETIEDGARWIISYSEKGIPVKDLSVFDNAVDSFKQEFGEIVTEYEKQGW